MATITNQEILLALAANSKIGPRSFQILAQAFKDDFLAYWQKSTTQLSKIVPGEILKKFLEAREKFSPEQEKRKLKLIGADFLTIYDDAYPPLLKEIYDPPFIIYYKGAKDILKSTSLAVVGSRKFTQYGKKIGYKLAYELAESGLTIVSGLALGLDSIVQEAAVDAKGKTTGVLACGVDQIYPAQNKQLAEKIINLGGIIITEKPPGSLPMKQHFPARNRIISGLSLGTLVVEAADRSGSLITAASALEQNREVFAVPGNVDSPNSLGTNSLLKMGAKLVTETNDILAAFNFERVEKAPKKFDFSEDENIVINLLKTESRHIDKMAQTSKLDIVRVSEILTILELKGAVRHLGGSVYQLNIL